MHCCTKSLTFTSFLLNNFALIHLIENDCDMKKISMLAVIIIVIITQLNAQDSTIKASLDNKRVAFSPTNMMPASGKSRPVTTSEYSLQVKGNDTLVAYLPYVGRSYNAPINPSDAGINFTSTNFTYTVTEGKKNSYKVVIVTKDRMYNSTFTLTVYDNGTAYLNVISNDKQSISYNGSIKMDK
jgi:hypothetical protein